jgi:hypothetical protein
MLGVAVVLSSLVILRRRRALRQPVIDEVDDWRRAGIVGCLRCQARNCGGGSAAAPLTGSYCWPSRPPRPAQRELAAAAALPLGFRLMAATSCRLMAARHGKQTRSTRCGAAARSGHDNRHQTSRAPRNRHATSPREVAALPTRAAATNPSKNGHQIELKSGRRGGRTPTSTQRAPPAASLTQTN